MSNGSGYVFLAMALCWTSCLLYLIRYGGRDQPIIMSYSWSLAWLNICWPSFNNASQFVGPQSKLCFVDQEAKLRISQARFDVLRVSSKKRSASIGEKVICCIPLGQRPIDPRVLRLTKKTEHLFRTASGAKPTPPRAVPQCALLLVQLWSCRRQDFAIQPLSICNVAFSLTLH